MLPGELDLEINKRIHEPTVAKVYHEWKNRGLLEETVSLLTSVPLQAQPLLSYAFATHVHKEKGLFLDIIGKSVGVKDQPRHALSVSADLLWALSLVIDDIEDGDIVRGGQESCWVRYGRESAILAAFSGLNILFTYLEKATGDNDVVLSCMRYIQIGLNSLKEHKTMSLETPKGIILRNYERRCDFHGTFQLAVMFEKILKGLEPLKMNQAITGLRGINIGGQLINDLKDLTLGNPYQRSFSDLQNGVPTIPLVELAESLPKHKLNLLWGMVGKKRLTVDETTDLGDMVKNSGIIGKIYARVSDSFDEGLSLLAEIVDSNQMQWFNRWTQYKLTAFRRK